MPWVPIALAAAGAIAGKAKNDRARDIEDSDRKLASATQRYSPWTGMQAGPIRHAGSAFGDMFGGAVQGGMMGSAFGGMGGGGGGGMMSAGGGGAAGMGAQEAGQTLSPWEKMQMAQKPMFA